MCPLGLLKQNMSGVVFTAKDDKGNNISFVESQLVADILGAYQQLMQVMIGEAICVSELKKLLNQYGISS